ncbi:MAG: FAD:protein FMN transferase [Sedimentisphaerales bacterium]|nr:FAD:protein FMN transferase [Sedimentisphaerales bacterium]
MTEPEIQSEYLDGKPPAVPGMKRFSHEAMATTFEIIVAGYDETFARQAAAVAFEEVNRLEAELSRFIENSDVARINNLPANRPLILGLDTFECLKQSCRIYAETDGAFDVTIGPLLSCWRNIDGSPREPSEDELDNSRRCTGSNLLRLNEDEHTIELLADGVQVDLGGIGKGYAVDKMAELLRQWSIETVLISGGYSSVLALHGPPDTKGWPLTLSNPQNRKEILARPNLANRALGSSGIKKGRHIINPRTMEPVRDKYAAWSSAPDAATADALSTAFMIMSTEEIKRYCSRHSQVMAMIMPAESVRDEQGQKIMHFGTWKADELLI